MIIRSIAIFTLCFLVYSCISTEGEVELKGKTLDESTNQVIPNCKVVVEAIIYFDQDVPKKVGVGQFISDSLGCFSFKLKKVRDAYNYNFLFVGDTSYASTTKNLGIMDIADKSKYLFLYLQKLTKLTIQIAKNSKSTAESTLYLSWKSDGIEGKTLHPYKLLNFGATPEFDFKWYGNNVNSEIETRVLADKPTIINWEIWNGRKKQEIIDTIICKRDITNFVNFSY